MTQLDEGKGRKRRIADGENGGSESTSLKKKKRSDANSLKAKSNETTTSLQVPSPISQQNRRCSTRSHEKMDPGHNSPRELDHESLPPPSVPTITPPRISATPKDNQLPSSPQVPHLLETTRDGCDTMSNSVNHDAQFSNTENGQTRSSGVSLVFFFFVIGMLILIQWDFHTNVLPRRKAAFFESMLCRNIVAEFAKGPKGLDLEDRRFFHRPIDTVISKPTEIQVEWLRSVQAARIKVEKPAKAREEKGSELYDTGKFLPKVTKFFLPGLQE